MIPRLLLSGLFAPLALGLGLFLTGSSLADSYQLEVHIDHDRRFVHSADVGIRGTPEALAAVQRVTYTFLPAPIDARRWAAGEEFPELAGSTVLTVTERGEGEDGVAFERRREILGWLPVQIVATVAYLQEEKTETLRLAPFSLELPDPSIRVGFRPIYESRLMAGEKGLTEIPALTSIELQFERLDGIATVGVAIGRNGDLHGVVPSFETWTVDQLREAEGKLHLGSIDNRRGVPVMAVGDRRDFIWVVATDAHGRVESYGAWRPQFLRESLDSEAVEAARAGGELRPFARITP